MYMNINVLLFNLIFKKYNLEYNIIIGGWDMSHVAD